MLVLASILIPASIAMAIYERQLHDMQENKKGIREGWIMENINDYETPWKRI